MREERIWAKEGGGLWRDTGFVWDILRGVDV